MWNRLKRNIPEDRIQGRPNNTECVMQVRTGHVMRVVGLDDPDALRGSGLWFFMGRRVGRRQAGDPARGRRNGRRPAAALEPAAARARRAVDRRQHQSSTATASARPSHITSHALTSTSRRRHSLMLARCTCRSTCRLRETVLPGRWQLCVIVRSLRPSTGPLSYRRAGLFCVLVVFSFVTCNFEALCYH
jgi:hypothetical protein